MGNNLDFRISQPALVQALETYRTMETLLAQEKEKQLENADRMGVGWDGAAAQTTRRMMAHLLEEGVYGQAARQVRAMRASLEEALPAVNALLARCEGFPDQLTGDDYTEPPVPSKEDSTERNGGILSLNYGKAVNLKDACDRVAEDADALTDRLSEIVRECGGLIDGAEECLTALEEASKKLHRIENYKESFTLYEAGVKALEADLSVAWRAISGENAESGTQTQNTEEESVTDTWTDEETVVLCLELEECLQAGDYEKMQELLSGLIKETREVRETAEGTYPYYHAGFDREKIAALVQASARQNLQRVYQYALALEQMETEAVRTAHSGSGSYELSVFGNEDGNIHILLSIRTGNGDEGIWRAATVGYVDDVGSLTDAEVVERFEAIPNYNIIVRLLSEDKDRAYNYKQLLAARYYSIKLEEGRELGEAYGILEDMPYIFNDVPYIDGKELEEWNRRQVEAFERYIALQDQGVDMTWIETYYQHCKGEEWLQQAMEDARDNGVEGSLDSVLFKTVGAIPAAIYTFGSYLTGSPLDTDSAWYQPLKTSQGIRQTVEEGMGGGIFGGIKKLAYRTAMGAADFVTADLVTGGHGVVLAGVEGYAEQGLEGVQRGLSPDVIQEEALLMGLGDAAMGKVMGNAGDTTLFKSMLEGLGTGAVSSILTNEADTLLAGDRSHVALDYQIGRAAGLSDEEARQAASIKEVKRIVLDALQGMSMAGVFHTAGKIIRVADAYLGFEDRGNPTDDGNMLRNLEESANIQRKERATGGTGEDETGIGRNMKKPPVVEDLDGDGSGVGEGGSKSKIGDFTNLEGSTVDDILDRIPDEATLRELYPVEGGATEGFEFKWVQDGQTYRVRVHNADPGAPAGSNAANGWILRIQRGTQYYDYTINEFQPARFTNPNGPFFDESIMNNTHIPILDPYAK